MLLHVTRSQDSVLNISFLALYNLYCHNVKTTWPIWMLIVALLTWLFVTIANQRFKSLVIDRCNTRQQDCHAYLLLFDWKKLQYRRTLRCYLPFRRKPFLNLWQDINWLPFVLPRTCAIAANIEAGCNDFAQSSQARPALFFNQLYK